MILDFYQHKIILLVFSLIWLCGCAPASVEQVDPLIITRTEKSMATPKPSVTQSPSSMPTLSHNIMAITPIPTQTDTQFFPAFDSTLSPDEESSLVRDLLRTNNDCELPCWWGIKPGVTQWRIVQDYFLSMGKEIKENYDGSKRVILEHSEDGFIVILDFIIENDLIRLIVVDAKKGTSEDLQLQFDDAEFPQIIDNYRLSSILKNFGKPEESLFLHCSEKSIEPNCFSLLMYYPDHGMMVEYWGESRTSGNVYIICPENSAITMWLWPNEVDYSIEYLFINRPGSQPQAREIVINLYGSLEYATGIDADKLIELFQNGDDPSCLETPKYLWD